MTLSLELGQVGDPHARRALEQVALQWPIATVPLVGALPAVAASGTMVFNTADNHLYVYSQGWKLVEMAKKGTVALGNKAVTQAQWARGDLLNAMLRKPGAGTVAIGKTPVTQEQWQRGDLLNAMLGKPAGTPIPPATAAAGGTTGPLAMPPDPSYEQERSAAERRRDTLYSGLTGARTRGLADYGYTEDAGGALAFDPNNPFSKASLLKKNYDVSRASTGNQMAAGGQLYAGSYQTAQDSINRGQLGAEDTLQKALGGFLSENTGQRAQAGIDYETEVGGINQAERAAANPLYEPTASTAAVTPPVTGATPAKPTVSAPNIKPVKNVSSGTVFVNGKKLTQKAWARGDMLKAIMAPKKKTYTNKPPGGYRP